MASYKKILCFTLNTHGTYLCEKYYTDENDKISRGLIGKGFSFTKRNPNCYNPIFFVEIAEYIEIHDPDMVVFTTVDDPPNGTYFHSDFLESAMFDMEYTLLGKDKYSLRDKTIRMSIYIDEKKIKAKILNKGGRVDDRVFTCQDDLYGLVMYVQVDHLLIAFIGVNIMENTIECYRYMQEKFLRKKNIDVAFVMGDLAFDLTALELLDIDMIDTETTNPFFKSCNQDRQNRQTIDILYLNNENMQITCEESKLLNITSKGMMKAGKGALTVFDISVYDPSYERHRVYTDQELREREKLQLARERERLRLLEARKRRDDKRSPQPMINRQEIQRTHTAREISEDMTKQTRNREATLRDRQSTLGPERQTLRADRGATLRANREATLRENRKAALRAIEDEEYDNRVEEALRDYPFESERDRQNIERALGNYYARMDKLLPNLERNIAYQQNAIETGKAGANYDEYKQRYDYEMAWAKRIEDDPIKIIDYERERSERQVI